MLRRHRDRERGSMLILVMVILIALLTGAMVMLRLQVSDTRAASMANAKRRALYCAEAGLEAGRAVFGQNPQDWDELLDLDTTNDPLYYTADGLVGDIDADGVMDYKVSLRDNDDEFPPAVLNPNADNDLRVMLLSECTKYPDIEMRLISLVGQTTTTGHVYKASECAGGSCTNNEN